MSGAVLPGDDEVVREFLLESHEALDRLGLDLVALEDAPDAQDRLDGVFRTVHTVKGTCGFLGFRRLEALAHAGEDLLGALRSGEVPVDAAVVTGLLQLVDAVRAALLRIEASGSDGDDDGQDAPLVEALVALREGRVTGSSDPAADLGRSSLTDATLRVDVALLDRLMTLVGELVLARNRVLQFTRSGGDAALASTSQRLDLITSELQEGVMKTRMQPVGHVWSTFPRVARDLGVQCGKQVRLELSGEQTELDKTIVEAVRDPLTHLLRNAVDHGLETPEARRAAGKPETGRLSLRAFHEGGQVIIEVSDDGAGLDLQRIRARAVERSLLTAEQAARLGDRDSAELVFLPGFSTATTVSSVSGRGVGMDVVRTGVERVGGSVDLQSRRGHGTTVRIRIPLTLAIIPALIVVADGDRYAIPQVNLLELVRLEAEQQRAVEHLHGAPVYRLRGELLPLLDLRGELRLPPRDAAPDDPLHIVVLRADDRQFGLLVDAVDDTEEIVVKPLGRQLQGIATYAGATVMGDGGLALILDVLGLAQQAGIVSRRSGRTPLEEPAADAGTDEATEALVVLQLRGGQRACLPLARVARLEEFPRALLERGAGRDVVQYRGELLPLLDVATLLDPGAPAAAGELVQVVVHVLAGRSVGLVVEEIVDIVDEHLRLSRVTYRPGLLGSAVVQDRVTDVLDVDALVEQALGPVLLARGA